MLTSSARSVKSSLGECYADDTMWSGLTHVGGENVCVAAVKDFTFEVRRQGSDTFLVVLQSYIAITGQR